MRRQEQDKRDGGVGVNNPVLATYLILSSHHNSPLIYCISSPFPYFYEQSIETTFKFPAQISPLTNQGGDRDNGDVYAKVSLNYDYLKNSNQIRINTLSGYWTPLNNFILIDNRKTGCHNGVPYGSSITKYPTSNTFSYNTGWGYVDFYPGSLISGARAYSEARVIIPGMGSGYIFKLDFFLQNP